MYEKMYVCVCWGEDYEEEKESLNIFEIVIGSLKLVVP